MNKALGIIVAVLAGVIGFVIAGRVVGGLFGSPMKTKVLPEASLEKGWKKFDGKRSGFTIQLPEEYKAFDPKGPEMEIVLKEAARINPGSETSIRQLATSGDFALMALDLTSAAGSMTRNVNVIKKTNVGSFKKGDKGLQEFKAGMEKTMPAGAQIGAVEFVSLPIGDAIRAEVTLAMGDSKPTIFSYSVPNGRDLYVVTATCDSKEAAAFKKTAEKMMQTFRISG